MEYQYDQLGRLLSAATQGAGGWGLAWNHDGFGNLTQQSVTKGQMTGFTHSVNGATNRINGQNYDANGNWTGSYGQMQTYDIENRIQTAYGPQYSELYLCSGRNERIVSKRGQDRHRVHFYGADGLLLGIYTLEITQQNPSNTYPVRIAAQERLYFGGRLMQIGGEWVATDRLGSVVRKGTTNYKYAPYGQEIGGATDNDTNKFATYTRDSLSGLDYALNRYYKPEWGRFTSPDPYQASGGPADPGSWNRYAYVGGDPVNYSDELGLFRRNRGERPSFCDIYSDQWYCNDDYPFDPNPAVPSNIDDHPEDHDNDPNVGQRRQQERKDRDHRTGVLCDPEIIDAMKRAWMRSGNGSLSIEAGFRLDGTPSQFTIHQAAHTNQAASLTMDVTSTTFALFHTHPSKSLGEPSAKDKEIGAKYQMDMYVLHRLGLFVYEWKTGQVVQLSQAMDWSKPCPKQ